MTTKLKVYDYASDENFRNDFRDILEEQFMHDWYNKSSGDEDRFSDSVTPQDRNNAWFTTAKRVEPLPNNVFDYNFEELFEIPHIVIQPELLELA